MTVTCVNLGNQCIGQNQKRIVSSCGDIDTVPGKDQRHIRIMIQGDVLRCEEMTGIVFLLNHTGTAYGDCFNPDQLLTVREVEPKSGKMSRQGSV